MFKPAGHTCPSVKCFPLLQPPNTRDGVGTQAPSARPQKLRGLILSGPYCYTWCPYKPQVSGSGYSNHIYFSREHSVLRVFPEHLLCWLVLRWGLGDLNVSQI